jgi:glycosyltransferase involved in cell wall biosynthesis
MTITIGFVFNTGDIIGGGEISFMDLISCIRSYNVKPIAYIPEDGPLRNQLASMDIDSIITPMPRIRPWSCRGYLMLVKQLAERFKHDKLDLVHANGARCMLYAGPAASWAKLPCAWHVRVLERDRLLDRIRAAFASLIIVNSRIVAGSLGKIVKNKRIEPVYNGFPITELSSTLPIDICSEFGISPEKKVVLYAGRISRSKGVDDLIRAYEFVKKEYVSCVLLLAGKQMPADEYYKRELHAYIKAHHLTDVIFCGWRTDMGALMKSAAITVLPSHCESFGRVIIEAWAAGCPVIASRSGGPEELINDGEDGMLVRVGDINGLSIAIVKILTDANLSRRLVQYSGKRLNEFSLESHARKIATLYQEMKKRRS